MEEKNNGIKITSAYTVLQGETYYSSGYTAFSDDEIANLLSSIESLTFDSLDFLFDFEHLGKVC